MKANYEAKFGYPILPGFGNLGEAWEIAVRKAFNCCHDAPPDRAQRKHTERDVGGLVRAGGGGEKEM